MKPWLTFAVLFLACGTAELDVSGAPADESLSSSADALTGNVAIDSVLETTDALNLRSAATTSSTVLRVMPLGSRVTAIERTTPSNGFYRVKYQGIFGWAHGSWLKYIGPGCGEFAAWTVFNCSTDGLSRFKCASGVLVTEKCSAGCSVMPEGVDDRCVDATPNTIDTVAEANAFFVNQWGPTAFTSGGSPFGFSDCVPTSGLMVLGALGLRAHPSPANALTAIDQVRDLALGFNSTFSQPMGIAQLDGAFRHFGAPAGIWRGTAVSALDGIISRGHFAVAAGGPWAAWGSGLNAQGKYLNFSDPGPHAVAVLGKTPQGTYLVADPLSSAGTITVTASQLATFLSSGLPGIYEYSR